ncbi:MAG: MFS transporter, partial [bacterium]
MNEIKRDNNGLPVHPMAKSNLSMLQKIMYSMGNMGGNFLNLLFTMWITKFYCPPTGEGLRLLNIRWVTNAILAGRVVDGIADPPIGYMSDRARTRWGRRIPFILFGGLPLCLVFFLLWAPPTSIFKPESKQLFAYFVGL